MLPKPQRLNLKKDFSWVASGKKMSEAPLRVETKFARLFLRVGENEAPRVGIALASKTFKKAHARNRARRLTSAAFESLYKSLPNHMNIVALPKAGILEVKSGDVLIDIEEGLREILSKHD